MKKLNQRGFSAVEAMLGIIIVVLIVFVGYYIYHTQKSANNTLSSASSVAQSSPAKGSVKKTSSTGTASNTTGSTTGWGSYTTKNFKVSFKYPADWKLTDSSDSEDDMVQLTSSSGFVMNIDAVDDGAPSVEYQSLLFNKSITLAGATDYLDFLQTQASTPAGSVDGFFLSTSSSEANHPVDHANFALNVNGQTKAPETAAVAQADADYANAVLVVNSISF